MYAHSRKVSAWRSDTGAGRGASAFPHSPRTGLLRLLHVSDLHVGAPSDGPLVRKLALFHSGFRGHSDSALLALHRFARQLERDGPVHTVVTGDLTAQGSPDQLTFARNVLTRQAQVAGSAPLGLPPVLSGDAVIPGNHDGYGDSVVPGRRLDAPWGLTFTALPALGQPVQVGGWTVRVLRIDTSTDVQQPGHLQARGSFRSQLATLARQLATLEHHPKEIRVLLLHHAPSHRGSPPVWTVEIDTKSRTALQSFAEEHRVSVMLSGHTHVTHLRKTPAGHWPALDATAGTATQDTDASGFLGYRPRDKVNAVLVHALTDRGQSLRWSTRAYVLQLGRFRPATLPSGDPLGETVVFQPLA